MLDDIVFDLIDDAIHGIVNYNIEDVTKEISNTGMMQFCKYLYNDINENIGNGLIFIFLKKYK